MRRDVRAPTDSSVRKRRLVSARPKSSWLMAQSGNPCSSTSNCCRGVSPAAPGRDAGVGRPGGGQRKYAVRWMPAAPRLSVSNGDGSMKGPQSKFDYSIFPRRTNSSRATADDSKSSGQETCGIRNARRRYPPGTCHNPNTHLVATHKKKVVERGQEKDTRKIGGRVWSSRRRTAQRPLSTCSRHPR